MKKYVCSVCGYIYEEAKGILEAGIAPGTAWEALPENWVCPVCGAARDAFRVKDGEDAVAPSSTGPVSRMEDPEDLKELTTREMSILCSNLSRGCEKQYKTEEAQLFQELAAYYRGIAAPAEDPSFEKILERVNQDLEEGLPKAHGVSAEAGDRGALRALVWCEKVTRILKSLLDRYAREGDAMLENTGVYVCTICGFIYLGENPPELCPVCKVPGWKFEKIEGRTM